LKEPVPLSAGTVFSTSRPFSWCDRAAFVREVRFMRLLSEDRVERAFELFADSEFETLDVFDVNGVQIGTITLNDIYSDLQNGNVHKTIGEVLKDIHLENSISVKVKEDALDQYSKLLENPVFIEIINSLYDGVYITDGDGITVFVNKAYERMTGIKAEQLVGYHMRDLISLGYISKSASIQVIKEKRPVTLMQTIQNGRKIIVSGTPVFNENNNILYVVSSVRDITELLKLKYKIEDLQELKNLRDSSEATFSVEHPDFTISSYSMKPVFEMINRASITDAKILLQGETGVGKTMIAKYIHEHSKRFRSSFLELNCGALPASLIEAELFGYEPGAFTGALSKGKKGLLEVADQGTLFLDEIGDLPLELQVKILKVIEDQAFIPIGGSRLKKINVRIIAASHKNIKKLVESGEFREDLYYRLNVIPVNIPPLRKRREEIIPLAQYFLDLFNKEYEITKKWSIEALDVLHEYDWPGNIRELKNLVERVIVLSPEPLIMPTDLPMELVDNRSRQHQVFNDVEIMPLKEAVECLERDLIKKALKKHKTTRQAAAALDVSQSTIVQKMKKWEL
jgi:PAS domain S-box-containing protein